MKHITKLKLASVHQICEIEEKSTEYMLQCMQDFCNVDLDCCVAYMQLGGDVHQKLFDEINELANVITLLDRALNL